jgi:hypothetical protein
MNKLPRTGVKDVQGRVFSAGEALAGKVPYVIAPGQVPEDFPGWPAGYGWKLKAPSRWPDPGSLLRLPQTVWLVNGIHPGNLDEMEFIASHWYLRWIVYGKYQAMGDPQSGVYLVPGDELHWMAEGYYDKGDELPAGIPEPPDPPTNKVPNYAKPLNDKIKAVFADAAAEIERLRPGRTFVEVIDYNFRDSPASLAGDPMVNGLFPICLPADVWKGQVADRCVPLPFFGLSVDRTWDIDADPTEANINAALEMVRRMLPPDFPAAFPSYGWSMHPTGIEWPEDQDYYGPIYNQIQELYDTGQEEPFKYAWRWLPATPEEGYPKTVKADIQTLSKDEEYTRKLAQLAAEWGDGYGLKLGCPATQLDAGQVVRIVAEALRFDPATGKDLPE